MIARRLVRWTGLVLVLAGLLALAEVAITLAWQEPVGALRADRASSDARAELRQLTAAPVASADRLRGPFRIAAEGGALRAAATDGEAVGELIVPRLHRRDVLMFGSSARSLARGPAIYTGSPLPGEGGTVAIAGHRTTHGAPFRHIDRLRAGDRIVLQMPYARVVYVVRRLAVVSPSDVSVLRGRPGIDRLVLSACHPLFSADQRLVVIASQSTAVHS